MPDRLKGRRILITGAASGIGRRTARAVRGGRRRSDFARLRPQRLAEVARETGGVAVEADVTQEASVARAVEQGAAAMGGIDGVVNAAGIVIHGSVLDVGVADWKLVLDVNLTGTYIVVRCCLPWLAKARFATIVNIASGQGLLPNTPNMTAYAASKGGVVNLTRALAAELAPSIRVNSVCPGMVDTADDCRSSARSRSVRAEAHCRAAGDRTGHLVSHQYRVVLCHRRGTGR